MDTLEATVEINDEPAQSYRNLVNRIPPAMKRRPST